MRKIFLILLAFVMMLCLCACGGDSAQVTDPSSSVTDNTEESDGNVDTSTDGAGDTTENEQDTTENQDPATCTHSYAEATCAAPKTCTLCGATVGKAKDHTWVEATCAEPKTCSVCKLTEGEANGHSWTESTCGSPKTCYVCEITDGDENGHSWVEATCTSPRRCTVCENTDGEAKGHVWLDATCTETKICSVCEATDGEAKGHSWAQANCMAPRTCTACKLTDGITTGHIWTEATCTTPKTCTVCKITDGKTKAHIWVDATCTAPKTCAVCKLTEGKTKEHIWIDATCTAPKTCAVCNLTEGQAKGHSWVEATCTAPKTCSVCELTEGEVKAHSLVDAICTVCGAIDSSASPYAGKTLQIWAVTGESYDDPEQINAKNWMWMVRAAMVEWAAKNGVTLEFKGNYDQQNLISSLNAGDKPDFVLATEKFPEVANLGLIQPFTEAQVKKITDVIGDTWLQTYKGEVYGVLPPWSGAKLLRFNLTMMENYGVKTPYDYIAEGTWTWENFFKLCEEVTKDTNGDGRLDTHGCTTFTAAPFVDILLEGEDGKLTSNLEAPEVRSLAEMLYSAVVEKKCIQTSDKMVTSMEDPRVAMCLQDVEPFNFMHTYVELINGDIIAACLPPAQTADVDPRVEIANHLFGIPMNADESDAAVDMLCYILQAGMKFMADHSEGLMTTEYKGIEGITDYTKAYLEAYNKWLKERDEEYEYIEGDYDAEFYKEMLEKYNTMQKSPGKWYSGATANPLLADEGFEAMYELPPASSMATLIPAYQALLDKYNTLFVS